MMNPLLSLPFSLFLIPSLFFSFLISCSFEAATVSPFFFFFLYNETRRFHPSSHQHFSSSSSFSPPHPSSSYSSRLFIYSHHNHHQKWPSCSLSLFLRKSRLLLLFSQLVMHVCYKWDFEWSFLLLFRLITSAAKKKERSTFP